MRWAAYIAPEGNPRPGNEPAAYITVLVNTEIRDKGYEYDAGAAIENMILSAWEQGIGSCWLLSIDRDRIRKILTVPTQYKIDSVLALGYPAEEPVLEDMKDSIKYWKDKRGQLHIPKRKFKDIFRFNQF